ncbi:MAG: hypothetical protein GXW94_25290 [Serratia liquefaciens]|nr:hypothetical protein [Serratia liquefaciens]
MSKLKNIIPVANPGILMLPTTKRISKEKRTVVDKSIIQLIVNECTTLPSMKKLTLVIRPPKALLKAILVLRLNSNSLRNDSNLSHFHQFRLRAAN